MNAKTRKEYAKLRYEISKLLTDDVKTDKDLLNRIILAQKIISDELTHFIEETKD